MGSLALLTYDLFHSLKQTPGHKEKQAILNGVSVAIPVVLVGAAYILDTDDPEVENAILNISRHTFNCSIRFPTWISEWALLWVHFLWSGACIITFSMKSWLEVRNAKAKLGSTTESKSTKVARTLDGQKRRLFRIAMQTSTCLLLNVIVTVLISGALDDWSRASKLWLTCSTLENINSDRTNYEFAESQVVCSQETVTDTFAGNYNWECTSDCFYSSQIDGEAWADVTGLFCEISAGDEGAMQFVGDLWGGHQQCNCDCNDIIKTESPSMMTTTLSYLVQSLVTTIVGLNMAFREKSLNLWSSKLSSLGSKIRGTSAAVSVQPDKSSAFNYSDNE